MIGGLRYGCRELSPRYSQYVDEQTGPLLTDVIERHLLTCESCTREVAALRSVRDRLGQTSGPLTAGEQLQTRLVSIAGGQADQPLGLRAGTGSLPSKQQKRRRMTAAGVLVTLTAVLALGAIGLSAAPPVLNVDDLTAADRDGFTAALNRSPLEMPAVVAFMAVDPESSGDEGAPVNARAFLRTTRMEHPQAALTRAVAQRTAAHGTVNVSVKTPDGYRTAAVALSAGDDGFSMSLKGSDGNTIAEGFLPRWVNSVPDWQSGNYTLAGWQRAASIAGRVASVVEASLPNRIVGRWWLDEATGMVLGQERYDPDGTVTVSAWFTSFVGQAATTDASQDALVGDDHSMAMSLTQACPEGWACPETLSGLPLVWRAADNPERPTRMQSIYSDGVTTVWVRQRSGTLSSVPADPEENVDGGGSQAVPATVMWQSGPWVFTVSTNDCLASASQAADQLPHHVPTGPDPLSRSIVGWGALLGGR